MCGRFTRKENFKNLAALLGLPIPPILTPRYNIAPSQLIACIRSLPESSERECLELQWGLVPSWAKDSNIGNKMINARAETVAEKPSFRKAFKQQRCMVLADGFYEWKREENTKQPYYIRMKDHRPFCFAGIWEQWRPGTNDSVETCAMLTIGPNSIMKPIHHRMPVILNPQDYDTWLDPRMQNFQHLTPLLQSYPPEEMEAFPVSTLVNNPIHDHEDCIQPLN